MNEMIPGTGKVETDKAGPRSHPGAAGNEDGFALIFVIFTIMVVGILGALVLLYTAYALRSAVGVTPSSRAQTTAEAGLDTVHAMLASEQLTDSTPVGSPVEGTMWDGKGRYEVHVVKDPNMGDGDPYDWLVRSYGEYTTEIEGVERTFYRTLEEVITFAGGRYYSALDFVLFSKEGDIEFNLDGDLSLFNLQSLHIGYDYDESTGVWSPSVPSHIYAGGNIVLANSAKIFTSGGSFNINGNIVTERGDVSASCRSLALAGSDLVFNNCRIYSGILNPGGVGGGVDLYTSIGAIGGNQIKMIGNSAINAHGRLAGHDYGVRIVNDVGGIAGAATEIAADIKSNKSVLIENNLGLIASSIATISGSIHSGGDVEVSQASALGGVTLRSSISGSIYAAGDVDIYSYTDAWLTGGTIDSFVGGNLHAGGDVTITHIYDRDSHGGDYEVGGSIYGRNVSLVGRLARAGIVQSSVGGSIYCRGSFDLENSATGGGDSTATINGSIYTAGDVTMNADAGGRAGLWWYTEGKAKTEVSGGSIMNPPGLGGAFSSSGDMTLTVSEEWDNVDEAVVSVQPNARDSSADGPQINEEEGGDVQVGVTTPPESFSVPQATDPEPPDPHNEILMPECDFDYYRELAKQQESDGKDHYYSGDQTVNVEETYFPSSEYVVFVDGFLTIGNVTVPFDTKAVFVATDGIRINGKFWLQNGSLPEETVSEFQLISGGDFTYADGVNLVIDDEDRFFIYADGSVEYEMGWFRNVWGQITARGDITLNSHPWAFVGIERHGIKYKSPSVLGEAFRIPFTVKSWKEI